MPSLCPQASEHDSLVVPLAKTFPFLNNNFFKIANSLQSLLYMPPTDLGFFSAAKREQRRPKIPFIRPQTWTARVYAKQRRLAESLSELVESSREPATKSAILLGESGSNSPSPPFKTPQNVI